MTKREVDVRKVKIKRRRLGGSETRKKEEKHGRRKEGEVKVKKGRKK